ncbi:hypothetical protein IWW36_005718, partial [Coemansia brasiliensis]
MTQVKCEYRYEDAAEANDKRIDEGEIDWMEEESFKDIYDEIIYRIGCDPSTLSKGVSIDETPIDIDEDTNFDQFVDIYKDKGSNEII